MCGFAPPVISFRIVLQDSASLIVEMAKIILCLGTPLLGCFPIPISCVVFVFYYTFTRVIHCSQRKLRSFVTLLRSFPVPVSCVEIVLLDTFSIIVRGGLDDSKRVEHPVSKAIMDHYRTMPPQTVELSEASNSGTH